MNYQAISLVPLSIILGILILLSGCANPAPRESDPTTLPSIGFEAARIAAELSIF